MAEPFLGEIKMVGFNFAPRGWALCDGQLLAISSNSALFSLLGTTFGGDGETTFGLPDLRGRSPVHVGNGPGLSTRTWGQKGGQENVTLTTNQIPSHNHPLLNNAFEGPSNQNEPGGHALSEGPFYATGSPDARTNPTITGNTGQNQSHSNMPPYLAIYFVIALVGIFPSE